MVQILMIWKHHLLLPINFWLVFAILLDVLSKQFIVVSHSKVTSCSKSYSSLHLVLEFAAEAMPIYLFNDLFAYTTIDVGERIFIVLEENASIWRSVCIFSLTKFMF